MMQTGFNRYGEFHATEPQSLRLSPQFSVAATQTSGEMIQAQGNFVVELEDYYEQRVVWERTSRSVTLMDMTENGDVATGSAEEWALQLAADLTPDAIALGSLNFEEGRADFNDSITYFAINQTIRLAFLSDSFKYFQQTTREFSTHYPTCTNGTYVRESPLLCAASPAGTFGDGITKTNCQPGTFAAAEGQSACTECPPGRYQDLQGQSFCKYVYVCVCVCVLLIAFVFACCVCFMFIFYVRGRCVCRRKWKRCACLYVVYMCMRLSTLPFYFCPCIYLSFFFLLFSFLCFSFF